MTARERTPADQLPLWPEHLESMRRSRRPRRVKALMGPGAYVAPVRVGSGPALGWVGIRPDGDGWMVRVVLPDARRDVISLRHASLADALEALAEASAALRGGGRLDGAFR